MLLLLAAITCGVQPGRSADLPEITTVVEARLLTDGECPQPRPFTFTGTLLDSGPVYSAFKDTTGGVSLHLKDITTDEIPLYSTIRVQGMMSIDRNGERDFLTTKCDLLRTNAPEEPLTCTCADIRSGRSDFRLAKIRGVITAVTLDEVDPRFLWISFRDNTGDLFLTCSPEKFTLQDLQNLIDADVEITGLASPLGGLRHNLGRHMAVREPTQISVLASAPQDPFQAPLLSSLDVAHRQRASGVVIGVAKDRFFIRTQASRIIPVKPADSAFTLRPGTSVSVVGFATLDPYRILLSESLVRREAQSVPMPGENAIPMTLENLFKDSSQRKKISMSANGVFLRLRGLSTQVDGDRLLLSSGNSSAFIDLTVFRNAPGEIPPNGSTIEVQGLCIADFEGVSPIGAYPKFRHFTLYPSSPVDVRILSKPGWWTVQKLFYGIAALGFVLIAVLIWNRAIQVISEKRGRELYEEKIDHALAEQKVEERTRLAVELHDSVSQTLTGIALQLDGGEVETAKTMLASCRGELRRCLWDLRSRTFEEKDMTEAVTRTITPHLNGCAATVRFNVPRGRLSESLTHTILRIVRELVVNAIRHGRAKHIRIAGEMHENTVSFSVADDGTGFNPETAPGPEQGHFGLLGIRERIEDFNGSLKIASTPNQGAKFTVALTTVDETNER